MHIVLYYVLMMTYTFVTESVIENDKHGPFHKGSISLFQTNCLSCSTRRANNKVSNLSLSVEENTVPSKNISSTSFLYYDNNSSETLELETSNNSNAFNNDDLGNVSFNMTLWPIQTTISSVNDAFRDWTYPDKNLWNPGKSTWSELFHRYISYNAATSCRNRCGETEGKQHCWCNSYCLVYNTCCGDIYSACPAVVESAEARFGRDVILASVQCSRASILVISECMPTSSNVAPNVSKQLQFCGDNDPRRQVIVQDESTGLLFKNYSVFQCFATEKSDPKIWSLRFDIRNIPPSFVEDMLTSMNNSCDLFHTMELSEWIEIASTENVTYFDCYQETTSHCPDNSSAFINDECPNMHAYMILDSSFAVLRNIFCLACQPEGTVSNFSFGRREMFFKFQHPETIFHPRSNGLSMLMNPSPDMSLNVILSDEKESKWFKTCYTNEGGACGVNDGGPDIREAEASSISLLIAVAYNNPPSVQLHSHTLHLLSSTLQCVLKLLPQTLNASVENIFSSPKLPDVSSEGNGHFVIVVNLTQSAKIDKAVTISYLKKAMVFFVVKELGGMSLNGIVLYPKTIHQSSDFGAAVSGRETSAACKTLKPTANSNGERRNLTLNSTAVCGCIDLISNLDQFTLSGIFQDCKPTVLEIDFNTTLDTSSCFDELSNESSTAEVFLVQSEVLILVLVLKMWLIFLM